MDYADTTLLPDDSTGAPPQVHEPRTQRLALRFGGSGSEYFRIWIVNLLLLVVTLGLYFPYARARRMRYFYGNTWVGEHALAFHGQGGTMLRGYLMVLVLFVVFSVASSMSPALGLFALLVLLGLWPALFRSGQRFRMSNTSWRGLRLGFEGDTASAYRRLGPLLVVALLLLGSDLTRLALNLEPDTTSGNLFAAMAGLAMLLVPWCQWRLKHYQHGHYSYGGEQAGFDARVSSFYLIPFKAGLIIGVAGMLMGVLGAASAAARSMAVMVLAVPLFAALLVVSQSWYTARMQDMVWNGTHSRSLRFISQLRTGALVRLSLKNLLLTALTLGFYWPFAAVALARLRLEAVSVELAPSFDILLARPRDPLADASGDAAGEIFGIDAGL
ncbi:MAG: hypothetical protein RLZZ584_3214 [Pseudomonadota bacterium]|jgi:uncharacterized membrane protein YjgN (DUF898 family)